MSEGSNKDWKKVREEHETTSHSDKNEQEVDELLENLKDANTGDHSLEFVDREELEEQLLEAEKKASNYKDEALRSLAELENVRRRAQRDVENAHKYSLEKFIDTLLPVVDSLEQALNLAGEGENSAMHEGLELTMKLLLDALQKNGIEQINPVGEAFDPNAHEAMSMQENPDTPSNHVLTVFQRGYLLHGRVIRPARVIVSK
tara:strand:- start:1142 stop:1750 length:609 start_codon:yes stop_codon:yes gene_type:complete